MEPYVLQSKSETGWILYYLQSKTKTENGGRRSKTVTDKRCEPNDLWSKTIQDKKWALIQNLNKQTMCAEWPLIENFNG